MKKKKKKTYDELANDVAKAQREQRLGRQHRFDGMLTSLADLFAILSSDYGWNRNDFLAYYPEDTIKAALAQGYAL